ncbi:hypothetical protein OsI_07108 [Oryza sativa Indica Group]|uniref:Uncharacterized protein n=1 Tax=Oryza sativa subsp. indica TaxID=39946 RepID=A2X4I7_ORYSI|nr:hypothetical protein OsI_07108 [Oryza sativa Indica Group]
MPAASSGPHRQLLGGILLLLLLLLGRTAAVGARVTAVIVFGDSTVDAGNNNAVQTVVRSNFPPYGRDFPGRRATGRFCNGRLATDFYSEAYGLRPFVPAYLDPDYGIRDFATGVCFASAGSGLDVTTAGVFYCRSGGFSLSFGEPNRMLLIKQLNTGWPLSLVR